MFVVSCSSTLLDAIKVQSRFLVIPESAKMAMDAVDFKLLPLNHRLSRLEVASKAHRPLNRAISVPLAMRNIENRVQRAICCVVSC